MSLPVSRSVTSMPQWARANSGWLRIAVICSARFNGFAEVECFCAEAACSRKTKRTLIAEIGGRGSMGFGEIIQSRSMLKPRPRYNWRLRTRSLELGVRTLVMGVLNVTPDSFSDGGRFLSRDHAVGHALQMLDEGADILDIGGESTRPGAPVGEGGVDPSEELERVLPVIEDIRRERPHAIVSVDTYKAEVARAVAAAGAEIINDVSALRWDISMAGTVAELGCGVILMHSRGRPEEWRLQPASSDIVGDVKRELGQWSAAAV